MKLLTFLLVALGLVNCSRGTSLGNRNAGNGSDLSEVTLKVNENEDFKTFKAEMTKLGSDDVYYDLKLAVATKSSDECKKHAKDPQTLLVFESKGKFEAGKALGTKVYKDCSYVATMDMGATVQGAYKAYVTNYETSNGTEFVADKDEVTVALVMIPNENGRSINLEEKITGIKTLTETELGIEIGFAKGFTLTGTYGGACIANDEPANLEYKDAGSRERLVTIAQGTITVTDTIYEDGACGGENITYIEESSAKFTIGKKLAEGYEFNMTEVKRTINPDAFFSTVYPSSMCGIPAGTIRQDVDVTAECGTSISGIAVNDIVRLTADKMEFGEKIGNLGSNRPQGFAAQAKNFSILLKNK